MQQRRITTFLMITAIIEAINRISPFILIIYAQRQLGPAAFGFAQMTLTIMEVAILFVTCGYALVVAQIYSGTTTDKQPAAQRLGTLASSLMLLRFIQASLTTGALLIVCHQIPAFQPYFESVSLLSIVLFMACLDLSFVQLSVQRIIVVNITAGLTKIATLAAVLFFVNKPEDAIIYALLLLVSNSVVCIVSFLHAQKYIRLQRPTWDTMRLILHRGMGLAIVFAALGLFERLDLLLANNLMSNDEIGIYSGPFRLGNSIAQLIAALGMVFFSELLVVEERSSHTRHITLAFWVTTFLVLPVTMSIWIVDDQVMGLLFGAEMAAHGRVLSILLGKALLHSLAIVLIYQVLILRRRIVPLTVSILIASVVQIVAVAVFHREVDMIVLAGTAVLAHTALLLICYFLSKKDLDPIPLKPFVRLIAASSGATLILWSFISWSLWVALAASGSGYFVLVFVFNRQELNSLIDAIKNKL